MTVRAILSQWLRGRKQIEPAVTDEAFGALFDTRWYLEQNPDVAASGANPLSHYLRYGAAERRDPNPLFDTRWYLEQNPDVAASGANPLSHYLRYGAAERRDPNPLFDTRWYLEQNPDVAASGANPLSHYLRYGAAERRDPNPLFDTRWYLEQNPDVATKGLNPLAHYFRSGRFKGRAQGPLHEAQLFEEMLEAGKVQSAVRLLDMHEQLLPPDRRRTEVRSFPLISVSKYVEDKSCPVLFAEQGELIDDLEPVIIGCKREEPIPGSALTQSLYVARLNDASILGGTRFVFPRYEKVVLSDEEDFTFFDPSISPKSKNVWRASERHLIFKLQRKASAPIAQGIHLMAEADTNYFHFVFEVLPRLAMINAIPALPRASLLVTGSNHDNMRQALHLLNRSEHEVIQLESGVLYQVEELIYPSDASRILNVYDRLARKEEALLSPKWMRVVRRTVLDQVGVGQEPPHRKLYVRRGKKVRALANEAELEEKLIDLGYEIVSTEDLSFRNQVKLFAAAKHVIAPTGAGVTNLIWCQPGTRATILSSDHPYIQHNVWKIVAKIPQIEITILCGPRNYKVIGKYSVHDDYSIDLDAVQIEVNRAIK